MKLAWWMLSVSVVSAMLISTFWGTGARREIWLGMLGPLVSAMVSWIAMYRQWVKRPEGLTKLMMKAFVVKMVFFAVYIAVLLKVAGLRPLPFVISFMCYFIALHASEAFGLHRLQSEGFRGNN